MEGCQLPDYNDDTKKIYNYYYSLKTRRSLSQLSQITSVLKNINAANFLHDNGLYFVKCHSLFADFDKTLSTQYELAPIMFTCFHIKTII